jgi:hypothetical protein
MNMFHKSFLSAFLITLCVSLQVLAAPKKVYILSGQSNMVGYTNVADILNNAKYKDYQNGFPIEFYMALTGAALSYNSKMILGSTGMTNLKDPNGNPTGINTFGPELGIAKVLISNYPNDQMVFIKIPWSGTSLDHDWIKNQNNWGVYSWFINQLVTALTKIGSSSPQGYTIAGMFWMQGESDAQLPTDKDAAYNYSSNLKYFVGTLVRSFLWNNYQSHMKSINLPFVYGRIHQQSFFYYGSEVQYQQYLAQTQITCARCTDSSRLASNWSINNPNADLNFAPPHYDSYGEISVGLGLGLAMVDLLNGKTGLGCKDPLGPQSLSLQLMNLVK